MVEGHDLNKEFSDPDFENPSHSVLAKVRSEYRVLARKLTCTRCI